MHGFTIPDASLLGNFFGSLAVRQVGVPNFNIPILQAVKNEMSRKIGSKKDWFCGRDDDAAKFEKSQMHDEFMKFLQIEADKASCNNNYIINGSKNSFVGTGQNFI